MMLEKLRTAAGVMRSLGIYYGRKSHTIEKDRLYAQFVKKGDLVFDVGAHVGDRVACFRRLGARVVAVEPQPALAFALKMLYGGDRKVIIERNAVGRRHGALELKINIDNPTVSTASRAFIDAAKGAQGWEGQVWEKTITVPVTTLDALIQAHGTPSFVKIDVEGFEAEALAGLTRPVEALSFEFTTIQRDVAESCIARCAALGFRRYNAALGESQVLGDWRSAEDIGRWLRELPHAANSGDIYARMA
jgi:FkbM family methyltransferase